MARAAGLQARFNRPPALDVKPGAIFSSSFYVTAGSAGFPSLRESVVLPPGWQLIIPSGEPFSLKAGESQVRIVTFRVPVTAPSGPHQVTYSLQGAGGAEEAREQFTLEVLPVMRVEASVDESPDETVAGEKARVMMTIVNRGNGRTKVALQARGYPELPLTYEPREFMLDPGASGEVRFTVTTEGKLSRIITYVLTMTAHASDDKGGAVTLQKNASFQVLPRVAGSFEPYVKIPFRMRLVGAEDNDRKGLQGELSGSGALDEGRKKFIDLLARTPDLQPISTYAERDELRLNYSDTRQRLRFGDQVYSLSPLTEGFKYGRGAEVDYGPSRLSAGLFHLTTRWLSPEEHESGAFIQYRMSDYVTLRGNMLGKERDLAPLLPQIAGLAIPLNLWGRANIATLEGQYQPDAFTTWDAEYGTCSSEVGGHGKSTDLAYHVKMDGVMGRNISYSFERLYAGPRYFGYYNDNDLTYASLAFPLFGKMSGNVYYRAYSDNLALDVARGIANRERTFGAGTSCALPWGLSLSLDLEDLLRSDALLPADFDFHTTRLRWGLSKTLGRLSIQAFLTNGSYADRLLNIVRPLTQVSFYSQYNTGKGLSLSLYNLNGDNNFYGPPQQSTTLGASMALQLKKSLRVTMNYEKYKAQSTLLNPGALVILTTPTAQNASLTPGLLVSQGAQDRDQFFATATQTFSNDTSLTLWARSLKSTTVPDESTVFLTYDIPFGVQAGRKTSIGTIRGRIFRGGEEGSPPLAGIIVTTGNVSAVTDGRGEFIFPSLAPGTYNLTVSKKSTGLGHVAQVRMPLAVEVKGGETTRVDIPIVSSSVITGRVMLFAFAGGEGGAEAPGAAKPGEAGAAKPGEAAANLVEAGGLARILVEITDGSEVVRALSDDAGRFAFRDVRPGSWSLKIDAEELPPMHYLEQETYALLVKGGEENHVEIRVLPRRRTIRIIEKGTIREEKKKP
jgi:hypothetical protein